MRFLPRNWFKKLISASGSNSISRKHTSRFRPALEFMENRVTPSANPLGPQFTVSDSQGAEAGAPSVAIVNQNGDFVVSWESLGTDGSGIGVYAQGFMADGTPVGAPQLVNNTIQGNQSRPSLGSDGLGNVIISWQSQTDGGDSYDIMYKAGTFDGTTNLSLVSDELMVNTVLDGNQTRPTVAMDNQGNFTIAWQSDQNSTVSGIDIYARYGKFDLMSEGMFVNDNDFEITAAAGDQQQPTASMGFNETDGGKLIIAWSGPAPIPVILPLQGGEGEEGGGEDDGGEEESSIVISGTLYSYSSPISEINPVDEAHTYYQLTDPNDTVQKDQVEPAVAMNSSGNFILAWQAEGNEGSGSDVFSIRLDSAGDRLDSANILVNTQTKQPQRTPAIGIDENGNYLVTWQSQKTDAFSWGVVGRAFNADGSDARETNDVLNSNDFLMNVNEKGPQTTPTISMAPDGKTIVVWAGPFVPSRGGESGAEGTEEEGIESSGGHQPSLFGRIFDSAGSGDIQPGTDALNVNGLEFQIAVVGAGEDTPNAATVLSDGNFIVAWASFENPEDASGYGIYGQIVAPDGTLIGAKFLINQTTVGYQTNPVVTALPNGGFAVVWQSEVRGELENDPSVESIFGRIFTNDGSGTFIAGEEFSCIPPSKSGNQTHPTIASDSLGNFIVAWESDAQESDEDITEIYAQRFSATGTAIGAIFRVNTNTDTAQVSPKVAMNANGQFAIAWVSDHNIANDENDTEKSIFVRWFNADGVAPNPEFLATVYVKDAQEAPSIGIDAAGDMVVAWQSINQATGTGPSWDVFARQFRPDGTSPQAQEFQVNETSPKPQRFASIGVDEFGRFAIAWQSIDQDGSSWGIYQRQFRADATPESGEELVNSVTSGPQILPVYARNSTGNYGLFWSGTMGENVDGLGGRSYGINQGPNGPNMEGPNGLNGNERSQIKVPIQISKSNQDLLETLSVVISGVPDDAVLSAGTKQSNGEWLLTPEQLDGLSIVLANEAAITLTVVGIATEVKTGLQASTILSIPLVANDIDGKGQNGNFNYLFVGGSTVNQYDSNNQVIRQFDVFPGFTGSLQVASGDITGDGYSDVVIGAGQGGGPHIRAFDGLTGAEISSFFAYDPSFLGGVSVSIGDYNGDGLGEIITGAGPGGGPHVKIFNPFTREPIASFFAYDLSFTGGVSVSSADINQDGIFDIITGAGPGGGPHVRVFNGSNLSILKEFLAYDPSFTGGVFVSAGIIGIGAINTSSVDDAANNVFKIITGPGAGGGPNVKIWDYETLNLDRDFMEFSDSSTNVDDLFSGGIRVGISDLNNDGVEDLVTGAGPGGGPRVKVYSGLNYEILSDFFSDDQDYKKGIFVG